MYYAATLVEAHLCVGEPVVVVGGGNSAGQAAVFLAAPRLDGAARRPRARSRQEHVSLPGRPARADAGRSRSCCTVEVRQLDGDRVLRRWRCENNRTGERHWLDARALFVFIGAEPHARWLGDEVALDEHGFVLAGPEGVPSVAIATARAGGRCVRDQPRWCVRGRRRPQRFGEAGGLGGGRGVDGGAPCSRVPRRARRAERCQGVPVNRPARVYGMDNSETAAMRSHPRGGTIVGSHGFGRLAANPQGVVPPAGPDLPAPFASLCAYLDELEAVTFVSASSSQARSTCSGAAPVWRATTSPSVHDEQRRDALHAVAPRDLRRLVDVDLHELDLARRAIGRAARAPG